MRTLEHLKVYADERFFSAFPALVAWPQGDGLLIFRRARDQRYLFSDAEGYADADFNRVDHLDCRSHLAALRFATG